MLQRMVFFLLASSREFAQIVSEQADHQVPDGIYTGYQVPNLITVHASGCYSRSTPRDILIHGGKALMNYPDAMVNGGYDSGDNKYHLSGFSRVVTLVRQGQQLTGMLTWSLGGGICRYDLSFTRLARSPAPPAHPNQLQNGLYQGKSRPLCRENENTVFSESFDLKIVDGVAAWRFRGRNAFGYVDADSNITLIGNGLTITLTKTANGYSGSIDDKGQRPMPELGLSGLVGCQIENVVFNKR